MNTKSIKVQGGTFTLESGNIKNDKEYGVYASEDGKVNINTATSEELQTLSGIGPATAEKIIRYRTDIGVFVSIDEIKNVDGIGDKTFNELKDYIKV